MPGPPEMSAPAGPSVPVGNPVWQLVDGIIRGQNVVNLQIIRALDKAGLLDKADLARRLRGAADSAEAKASGLPPWHTPGIPRTDLLLIRTLAGLLHDEHSAPAKPDLRVVGGKEAASPSRDEDG